MATKKKTKKSKETNDVQLDDFSATLIKQLNSEHNDRIAYNLGSDHAPADIKRWISTGSKQLDMICSNKMQGGFPEGRIVEIQGPASSGKSHIAFEVAKSTQRMGGIVVYIDTENATSLNNLQALGVNVYKRFIFVQTACTEEVFSVAESTIMKARAMNKDVPVTIIWDSVAASSPKAEIEGTYEQNTIGLQARTIGKGMRKIVSIIGNQNVLFLLINQQRKNIGVMFGDDTTTPGGMAIPYSCSTRIRITSTGQKHVLDKKKNVVGIKVNAKTIKNKVAHPFRTVSFQIHFGKGIVEHEEVFDLFRELCASRKEAVQVVDENGKPTNEMVSIAGTGAWKSMTLFNSETGEVIEETKFHKSDFGEKVLYNPKYKNHMDSLFAAALIVTPESLKEHSTFEGLSEGSLEELKGQ